ncbi:MAG: class I mannose-6-phosphate isomerase [Verrucomicrobiales bacterium]|jgi:mannose-6-phosphate isomerase|nr:class I mannose-6-phosphate isomerase [Verrucomicrobiales bacterium]
MAVFTLQPIFQERIWGGRNLQTLFGRALPAGRLIGESWELADRPEAQTLLVEAGQTVHEWWASADRQRVFGTAAADSERFPILIKLLDARDKLSLQVHPPAALAPQFHGEPKTEMWYFLETSPSAEIYAGLKRGVNREKFTRAIAANTVADCFHVLKTAPGEAMFLPSGRVHAIGAGNVILEVQQNSDTTFRVYDWDRVGADGQPRALHVAESLACINFDDCEPAFAQPHADRLVECPYFVTRRHCFDEPGQGDDLNVSGRSFRYLFVARGRFTIGDREYPRGASLFVTAGHGPLPVTSRDNLGELVTVAWP